MKNPWVIAVSIFAVVAIVGLMVAAAIGLELAKSEETDVLLPALIAFAGVSLTLLASTLIPTLVKASSTEAAARRAAETSAEARRVLEDVHTEVNGKMAAKIEDGARRVVREEVPAMIEHGVRKVLRDSGFCRSVSGERQEG